MEYLKILANTKILLWISITEMGLHSLFHILGSNTAKWHLLGWMIWTIIILSCRVWLNGSVRVPKYNDR